MEGIELRRSVLLSIQRALWEKIYPEIRAIAVGYEGEILLKVICYLDREPNEDDYENLSDVAGKVCADIDFKQVDEQCVYSKAPISSLDNLESWVYIRKE